MLLIFPHRSQALPGTVVHWEIQTHNNYPGADFKSHYPLWLVWQSLGSAGTPAPPADGRQQGIEVQLDLLLSM